MSLKIYSPFGHQRANLARIAADINEIQYENVFLNYSDLKQQQIQKLNPQGKVTLQNFKFPFVETKDGTIFGTNAILRYIALLNPQKGLIPKSKFEQAQVDQWLDFVQLELSPVTYAIMGPILGHFPYIVERHKAAKEDLNKILVIIDDHLKVNNYIVGNSLTIADISLVGTLQPLFKFILEESERIKFKNMVRYFKNIAAQPYFVKYFGKIHLCNKEWECVETQHQNPQVQSQQKQTEKKQKQNEKQNEQEQKPQQQKQNNKQPKQDKEQQNKQNPLEQQQNQHQQQAQQKQNNTEANLQLMEDLELKKPGKNPLDNLPATTFNLYDFKTLFVNAADKQEALTFLWNNYDPNGFSIWFIKYLKYEGEGVKLFLTSNFKDSNLQRLDHLRKFAFAVHGVYGEVGNYEIRGVWLWRGTEIPQEIKDLPNYEYHSYQRLDHNNVEHRNLLNSFWSGLKNDVSVADGLVARDASYFK